MSESRIVSCQWENPSSPMTPSPPYVPTANVVSAAPGSYPRSHTYPPPYLVYPCYYPPPSWLQPHHIPSKPVDYIAELNPSDVLCGRGGATNSYSGNKTFRDFVRDKQDRYLQAKKRDKPYVAAEIVAVIRKRGGRFLKRSEYLTPEGGVLWIDIGDERAKEKTCQALREGAPELRRKRRGAASEGPDSQSLNKETSPMKAESSPPSDETSKQSASPSSSASLSTSTPDNKVYPESRDDKEEVAEQELSPNPFTSDYLRPCPRLMRKPVRGIPISELSPKMRQLYYNFVPPHPSIRKSCRREKVLTPNQAYYPVATVTRDEGSSCDDENDYKDDKWNDDSE